MSDLTRVLSEFRAVADPVIAATYVPNCCIAATRITVEVLRHFGVEVDVMPCEAVYCNARFYALLMAEGSAPQTQEVADRWEGAGARFVWIGADDAPDRGGWNGHLVAIARQGEEAYLVDMSARQAHRPHKEIVVPRGLIAPIPPTYHGGTMLLDSDDGTTAVYWPKPEKRGYRSARDWSRKRHERVVAAIIRMMKRRLAEDEQPEQ